MSFIFQDYSWLLVAIICTTGRTQDDFDAQGTGDRLVLQDGSDLTTMPATEGDAGDTVWTNGQCFFTMGQFVFSSS